MLNYEQVQAYDRDGFVLVENFFSADEVDALLRHVKDDRIAGSTHSMPDTSGRDSKLSIWSELSQDIFGRVSASPRVVDSARALLREDVYHWHSKVMLKEPKVGGAWEWHQDYGYWYHDGCLYSRMVSCLIALDGATRENGCLKVLTGSHHIGRLDHGQQGNQVGADPARLRAVEELLPVRYVEAPAGSALFFHCNLLHASEPNTSDRPRTSYICCYNAMSNVPYGGHGHGSVKPIAMSQDILAETNKQ